MGKTITPKYKLEIWDAPKQVIPTTLVWDGPASDDRLANYIKAYIDSLKIGGANEHISKSLGYIPVPYRATIRVNKYPFEVVAEWNAPMFMEI